MNSPVFVSLALLIIALLLYYRYKSGIRKKEDQELLDRFNKNNSNKALSKEQERMLVYGAILSYFRSEDFLSITPNNGLSRYMKALKNQWGIWDHDTTISTLDNLANRAMSKNFDHYVQAETEKMEEIKNDIAKGLDVGLQEVQAVDSTYAWDVCRMVSLAKWCYWMGYISEEEMWNYISKGAELAADLGKDWKEYTISFLLGRSMQGFHLSDLIKKTNQLYHSKSPSDKQVQDIDVYERFDFK